MRFSPKIRHIAIRLLAVVGIAAPASGARQHRIFADDTYLISYPRSGNTWMRHLIANIKRPGNEWNHSNINKVVPDMYQVRDQLDGYARPRIIKSHEAYQPQYPRVLYLYRDGRDVAVSYHNHQQTTRGYKGSFDQFLKEYLRGQVPFGSWQHHVNSWLTADHQIPFLAVKYERLFEDPLGTMKSVAAFLGIDADEPTIKASIERSSYERLQESARKHSPHYRTGYRMGVKGGPGKWRTVFTEENLELFWSYAGTTMEGLGYRKQN